MTKPVRFLARCAALAWALACPAAGRAEEDHRAWQHGVDLLRVDGRLLVVWSSPGNPPRPNVGGDWQHDVYSAWLGEDGKLDPHLLVARPEAQEPASSAINSRGTILMTSEDGNGGINQHAGMWDSSLKPLRSYPMMIRRGGHSGHVAAMGDRFLVTYSEGWVDGGGFLGRGTGKDVYARIVQDDGTLRREVKFTETGRGHRDDWPLVAGSERNWLVVWQRYPERSLQAALVGADGAAGARTKLMDRLPIRYAYDVAFAPQAGVYVVAGSTGSEGFVSLVDMEGKVVSTRKGLPPMASESRIVLRADGAGTLGAYPVRPNGVAVVRIAAGAVVLVKVVEHPYEWDYCGTAGAFVADDRLLFVTLSQAGLRQVRVDLGLK